MSPEVSSPPREDKLNKGNDEGESSSNKTPNVGEVESFGEVRSSEESSPEETRSTKKAKISHRNEAESCLIDLICCDTTQEDLNRLMKTYNIPDDIDL